MTTELEKQFFDTFGIEEGLQKLQFMTKDRVMRMETVHGYPEITDRHYLELYWTLCDAFNLLNKNRTPAFAFKVKYFKECILKDLIGIEEFYKNKHIKHQVQAIFEGER